MSSLFGKVGISDKDVTFAYDNTPFKSRNSRYNQVVELLERGRKNKDIAYVLDISAAYVSQIKYKWKLKNKLNSAN